MKISLPPHHISFKSRACTACGEIKPPEDFSVHKHKKSLGGVRALPQCKDCLKVIKLGNHLRNKYNMTFSDYETMLEQQNSECALCGSSGSGKDLKFVVDHCHTTGKVRGLLCWPCNIGIGMFKDNPILLHKVIEYLKS